MLSTRAFLIGITATLFPFFDIPVFWPILLIYWLMLVGITMRRQIKHMIKYKYLPFDFGKQVRLEKPLCIAGVNWTLRYMLPARSSPEPASNMRRYLQNHGGEKSGK